MEAFRWTQTGGMIGLGDLPGGGFESYAHAVSADGAVIVGRSWSASGHEAFIWDNAEGMRSLKDMLENDLGLDLTGWILSTAHDITPDGQTILGSGVNPSGDTEAWLVTIPEPATASLLVMGLGLMLARRRRRGEPGRA